MQAFKQLTAVTAPNKLAVGGYATFLLKNGELSGCGLNFHGQLGLGDKQSRNRFTEIELPESVLQVGGGGEHTTIITEDGRLRVCGRNNKGQLGLGDNLNREDFFRVDLPERVSWVSASISNSAVLTESGQLWVCGGNYYGQMGLGDDRSRNRFTHVVLPQPGKRVVTGSEHIALITESGRLWVCGNNDKGQLGLGNNVRRYEHFTQVDLAEPVIDVSVGRSNTAVITESGQLWLCGSNVYGQLGLGDDANRNLFTRVALPERASQVALGAYHTALITENGQLWVCGRNDKGQLGLSDENAAIIRAFKRVRSAERVRQVVAGFEHTALITERGRLWVCGFNFFGQLGLGDNKDRYRFTLVGR